MSAYSFIQSSDAVGVPVMAQWLTSPTRNHEVVGSIPGLAQWCCSELWCRSQTQLRSQVAVGCDVDWQP